MQYRSLFVPILCLLVAGPCAVAQDTVTGSELTNHILRHAPLQYPAIASAAHVQGTVVLQIRVGINGTVESMKTISGPPMLVQAAKDSVKQWKFRPFEKNGSAVEAIGPVSVDFALAGEKPNPPKKVTVKPQSSETIVIVRSQPVPKAGDITVEFITVRSECVDQLRQSKKDSATAAVCKKAADIAEQFAPDNHYIDKRLAFVDAATALRNSGDLVTALVYATKAVDVTNLGHDLDFGRSEAYATEASIEFYLGDLSGADKDLGLSERYERKAIAWAQKEAPINIPDYKKVLGQELRFHANVSLHMNHAEAARKELAEASSL